MEKKRIINITLINFAILVILAIGVFLVLPDPIQRSYSSLLYAAAVIAGSIIGNLVAKVYFLRKKLLAMNNELIQKHEDLQVYIGNVVHDLRSPVAAINMIAELLENDLSDIDPANKQLITSMRKSSHNMLQRICTLLDNREIQDNNRFEHMRAGQPDEIIKAVINKLHILAIEKNIKIEWQEDKDIPSVYFDCDALESIFTNLVSNAIKYSMPNTTIAIYHTVNGKKVTYHVKDQGLGMTKDDLTKVFGRYTKLSARPTGGEDSSGLGLSIVKELVEKMNGSVQAASKGKGKGSTFSITLSATAKEKRLTA